MLAIFALMLILNRQTGAMFEEMLLFIFPIPMTAYAARYGWKSSLPVMVGIAFFSFLFGTITTIFYAVSEALVGLVFGHCIYKKVEPVKTLFAVIVFSVIANVFNMFVLEILLVGDMNQLITEMREITGQLTAGMQAAMAGNESPQTQQMMAMIEQAYSEDSIMQLLVVGVILLGTMQGVVIYNLSILILRRLQFKIPKLNSVYLIFPPKWTALAALLVMYGRNMLIVMEKTDILLYKVMDVLQYVGMYYLMAFGFIAIMFFFRICRGSSRMVGILFCIFTLFLPQIFLFGVAFIYIVSDWHMQVMAEKRMILIQK